MLLDQTQALTKHLVGILIPAALDKGVHEPSVVIGQKTTLCVGMSASEARRSQVNWHNMPIPVATTNSHPHNGSSGEHGDRVPQRRRCSVPEAFELVLERLEAKPKTIALWLKGATSVATGEIVYA